MSFGFRVWSFALLFTKSKTTGFVKPNLFLIFVERYEIEVPLPIASCQLGNHD